MNDMIPVFASIPDYGGTVHIMLEYGHTITLFHYTFEYHWFAKRSNLIEPSGGYAQIVDGGAVWRDIG